MHIFLESIAKPLNYVMLTSEELCVTNGDRFYEHMCDVALES